MDWPYRLVGLIVIFGLTISALVFAVAQIATIGENENTLGEQDLVTKRQSTVGKEGPAQLAFTEGGFNTGTHRIRPDTSLLEIDLDTDDSDSDTSDSDTSDSDEPEEPESTPEPEPSGPHSQGLDPGLYTTTFDAESCSYQLAITGDVPFDYLYEPNPYDPEDYQGQRVGRNDEATKVVGEDHLHSGRMLVSLIGIGSDSFTSSAGCGPWMPWSPLVNPLTKVTDGDYWMGDLVQGEWSVPPGCLWEKVVAFRGGRLDDVVTGDRGPGSVMIDEGTAGLRVRQCQGQSLIRIGDAAPYEPYYHPGPAEELTKER